MSIIIDSTTYNIPIKVLGRKFEQLFKYAERLQNGGLAAEVLAGYQNYDLEAGMSSNNVSDYAALYLKITEPVSEHSMTLLGATFNCYFANVRDEVVKDGATPYFRNLSFSVIATDPTRVPD